MAKKGIYFIIIFFIIFLTTSIITFHPHDFISSSGQVTPGYHNWFGFPGALISGQLFILFGMATYLFIPFFIFAYMIFKKRVISKNRHRYLKTSLIFIFTLSYFVVLISGNQSYTGGGIIAGLLNSLINEVTGLMGEILIFLFLILTMIKIYFEKKYIEQLLMLKAYYNEWKSSEKNKCDEETGQEKSKNKKTKKDKKTRKPPLFEKVTYAYKKNSKENFNDKKPIPLVSQFNNSEIEEEIILETLDQEKEQEVIWTHKVQDNNQVDKPFDENYLSRTNAEAIDPFRNFDNTVNVAKWKMGLEELPVFQFIDEDLVTSEEEEISNNEEIVFQNYEEEDFEEYNKDDDIDSQVNIDKVFVENVRKNSEKEIHRNDNIVIPEIKVNAEVERETPKNFDSEHHKESFASLAVSHLNTNVIQHDEKETSVLLEETLAQFGIEAKVNHISRGPVITRYEVLPAPGIKVSKIVGLQDNIALNLAASKIRIVAPIPGKSAVGIEIPNKHRDAVTLGDLLNSNEFQEQNYYLPIALGKGISGKTIIADLVTMPHLLIAGATGSGKSVFVNTLISSLLYSTNPEYLRFIMIDPKRVELKSYDDIPYLLAPVITEPKKAVVALKWAVNEMEERYKILEKYGCRDIRSYNKKVLKMKSNGYATDSQFEYIVIIIDEFADLMMVCGKEAEEQVSRLAAMSRAVGIHLVLATQRPSVDVITGLIKANFPARIAFQVSSKTESRIILDSNGADKLLGKGDMLFSAPGYGGSLRIQSAFLSDDEVFELSSRLKSLGPPDYIEELENIEIEGESSSDFTVNDEPLFREAVEIVLAEKKASASYLQRRLRVGYNRAARIIELMEGEGIISGQNGSKPREVLIENYEPI